MSKIKRQSKILEYVKNNVVETQDEIGDMLRAEGFNATQATISRDMRELRLTKVNAGGGVLRYALYDGARERFNARFLRVFQEGISNIDYAQNTVVIKTLEGMAMAVAACVDAFGFNDLLGCIAGDDTVFCVARSEGGAAEIVGKLRSAANGEEA